MAELTSADTGAPPAEGQSRGTSNKAGAGRLASDGAS